MASKKPSKPKLKNLPQRPKASASNAVWEKHNKKCEEIKKANKKALDDYNKAVNAHEKAKLKAKADKEKEKKRKKTLMEQRSKMKKV